MKCEVSQTMMWKNWNLRISRFYDITHETMVTHFGILRKCLIFFSRLVTLLFYFIFWHNKFQTHTTRNFINKDNRTNDDDNHIMSSTTKGDYPILKMKMTFSRSQTTPEDKKALLKWQKECITCVCKTIHMKWNIRISKWNTPVVSWSKKLYPQCLVLVGSRNGLQRTLLSHNCWFQNRTKIINTR